jgi:three-Cys-motif partner protein
VWKLDRHSQAKHYLLRRYLQAWLPIMSSWQDRLVLIDGFAGPGVYEDGQPGSPIIMLQAYLDHDRREQIDAELIYVFIEQDKRRATKLTREIDKLEKVPRNVQIEVIADSYENAFAGVLDDIEQRGAKLAPTFAFLDPFGYSDAPMTLTGRFLQFDRCEVLIYVPLRTVNRWLRREGQENAMTLLFGTKKWAEAVAIEDGQERIRYLHDLFYEQLKADWKLEEAGYTTVLQAWDFVPGSNFVVEMDKAARQAKRTIAVLSPNYVAASFTQPEWASAFAGDPTGAARKLVPVRVADCDPPGLLGQVVFLDLVGLDQDAARERLLAGVRERLKPSEAPPFPGVAHPDEQAPAFPGDDVEPPTPTPPTASEPRTWVKVDNVIFAVDELDDAGERITVRGRIDGDAVRKLDALLRRGFGSARVRFTSADRVAEADMGQLRRTTRGGATETTIELTRAEAVRANPLRAGTGGLTPDDLVEAGMREFFFGEQVPASLGVLAQMADPGLDRDALALAFALEDPASVEVVRLLLIDALVGGGNAQAVTRCEVGPRHGGARHLSIEWLEPVVYVNVPTQYRR